MWLTTTWKKESLLKHPFFSRPDLRSLLGDYVHVLCLTRKQLTLLLHPNSLDFLICTGFALHTVFILSYFVSDWVRQSGSTHGKNWRHPVPIPCNTIIVRNAQYSDNRSNWSEVQYLIPIGAAKTSSFWRGGVKRRMRKFHISLCKSTISCRKNMWDREIGSYRWRHYVVLRVLSGKLRSSALVHSGNPERIVTVLSLSPDVFWLWCTACMWCGFSA